MENTIPIVHKQVHGHKQKPLNIPRGLEERLACPDCKAGLVLVGEGLLCGACSHVYPVADNGSMPILHCDKSEFANPEYADWERSRSKGTRRRSYRQARLLPKTNVTGIAKPQRNRFVNEVGERWVLNVGSGEQKIILAETWVNLDIQPHNNCDVVGDANWLPFRNGSFDGVCCTSV